MVSLVIWVGPFLTGWSIQGWIIAGAPENLKGNGRVGAAHFSPFSRHFLVRISFGAPFRSAASTCSRKGARMTREGKNFKAIYAGPLESLEERNFMKAKGKFYTKTAWMK
jgi:hypothetical protein